ncbi:MAG: rhodanese-like domain-containing protein [Streptomycetales bacterium]
MSPRQQPVPSVGASSVPEGAHVLDVREPYEWLAGHVEGAQHIPLGELSERVSEVPSDRMVHVVCRSGGRSERAAWFLGAQGREAVNVAGGMARWAAAGRPMVTETGRAPEVA